MSSSRVAAVAALLAETEAAHGQYETTELNGVYDAEWPRWYAGYAVDHGIGAILGRSISADELAQALGTAWAEYERSEPRPAESWTAFIARRLAGEP
jgi:hypothetical protein